MWLQFLFGSKPDKLLHPFVAAKGAQYPDDGFYSLIFGAPHFQQLSPPHPQSVQSRSHQGSSDYQLLQKSSSWIWQKAWKAESLRPRLIRL